MGGIPSGSAIFISIGADCSTAMLMDGSEKLTDPGLLPALAPPPDAGHGEVGAAATRLKPRASTAAARACFEPLKPGACGRDDAGSEPDATAGGRAATPPTPASEPPRARLDPPHRRRAIAARELECRRRGRGSGCRCRGRAPAAARCRPPAGAPAPAGAASSGPAGGASGRFKVLRAPPRAPRRSLPVDELPLLVVAQLLHLAEAASETKGRAQLRKPRGRARRAARRAAAR